MSSLLAISAHPEELRRAVNEQAMVIERFRTVEVDCRECRATREEADQLILERFETISVDLKILRSQLAFAGNLLRAVFAVAGLAVAAKAAGLF